MRHRAKAGAMTGGMAIVEALIANGVDTVFGLPGAQLYPLFDALQQRSDADPHRRRPARAGLRLHGVRLRALDGAAGRVRRGAGARHAQHLGGAVHRARLLRAGAVHHGAGAGGVPRPRPGPSARAARSARHPALADEMGRAHRAPGRRAGRSSTRRSGRCCRAGPAPVAVEMAWDTMASSAYVEPLGAAAIPEAPAPSPLEVEAAAKLLAAARRPMIMTGSGAQHASDAVRALAEELDAPVAAFRGGRGIVPEDHALGISSYAAFKLWPRDGRAGRHRHAGRDALHALDRHDDAGRPAAGPAAPHPHRHRSRRDAPAGAARRHRCGLRMPARARCWRRCGACAAARARPRRRQGRERGACPHRRRQGRGARGVSRRCSRSWPTSTSSARCCRATACSSPRSARWGSRLTSAIRSTRRAPT